jgi:hypothetical protein
MKRQKLNKNTSSPQENSKLFTIQIFGKIPSTLIILLLNPHLKNPTIGEI